MKTKSETKKKKGGSHGTCPAIGRGQARPVSKENMRPASSPSKAVIAPPAVSEATMQQELLLAYEGQTEKVLRSETGEALFALIRLADGTIKAVASPEIKERMWRLGRGDKNDGVHELAAALRRLKKLPSESASLIYRNELDSAMRLNLACMLEGFQKYLGEDLQKLDDTKNKKRKKLQSDLVKRCQGALAESQNFSVIPKNMKADKLTAKVPWGLFGEKVDMPLALPAIIHARRFVEKQERLPTKKELTAILSQEYGLELSKGYWRKVWTGAGLNDLPKNAPVMEKQKGQLDRVRTKFTKTVQKA